MKKVLIILLSLVLCVPLSGCGYITNLINSYQTHSLVSSTKNGLISDSSYKMSGTTASLGNKLASAVSGLQEAQDELDSCKWWQFWKKGKAKKQVASYTKQTNRLSTKYEMAKASDSVFKESKGEATKSTVSTVAIVVAVIVVVAIVILLLVLAIKKQSSIVPAPAASTGGDVSRDIQWTDITVNYDKLLHQKCDKLGISYDSILSEHGGDARAAFEDLNLRGT